VKFDGERVVLLGYGIGERENSQELYPHSDALQGGVIWVALDEATKENGCLYFLKGSHLKESEFAHLNPYQPSDLSDHADKVEAAMSPGDTVFFKPTTVHWSGLISTDLSVEASIVFTSATLIGE